jgi:hypothetical protein
MFRRGLSRESRSLDLEFGLAILFGQRRRDGMFPVLAFRFDFAGPLVQSNKLSPQIEASERLFPLQVIARGQFDGGALENEFRDLVLEPAQLFNSQAGEGLKRRTFSACLRAHATLRLRHHWYLVTSTSAYGSQKNCTHCYRQSSRIILIRGHSRADPAAKPLFGSQLTLSDRFVRRRSSARITAGGVAHA